jgi:hypothetical protein
LQHDATPDELLMAAIHSSVRIAEPTHTPANFVRKTILSACVP